MLVPIKDPKRGWLLEDRPATRRAASTPGPSGKRHAHGPRTFSKRPDEPTKPLPFKPTISRVMAKLAGFLGLNRRKAA
jgi:hypothetical protein